MDQGFASFLQCWQAEWTVLRTEGTQAAAAGAALNVGQQ